jgi:hypothetical protein
MDDESISGDHGCGLFFVADAAKDRSIYPALREISMREPVVPLYEGASAEDLASVAPYILKLTVGSLASQWLSGPARGKGWGLFIVAPLDVLAVRSHLRRLTMVRTEVGRIMLFRFYDPAILQVFLPTCDEEQLSLLFGGCQELIVENQAGDSLMTFSLTEGKLATEQRAWPSNVLSLGQAR